ncbi:MAG TPA: 2-oxoglutarate dehydrogenase complex dihydrolipoyllysine-residue succinyltransferase [Opitutales bacterium]|jgi:2-oxoglutarate dehydrogenase E2 component (dihydrolipoamide succinyltransferase)|nr:2-oxoglutarate dehydrogenase complex dihydrolipoyllysine-residue succinyltransferase [Opitutales bacterium]
MIEVKIPALGESISSGILAKWHVKDGDTVKRGQPIFELETDKITSEGEAESPGRITLKAAIGAEVAIGQVVALIDETVTASAAAPAPAAAPSAAPAAQPETASAKLDTLSPAARRVAAETKVDPTTVAGSGKGGRVTKGDLLAASTAAPVSVAPSSASLPPPAALPSVKPAAPTAVGRTTRIKMSPLRKRIAERLVAAQHNAAILTTFNEVDMSEIMALRKKYQEDFTARHGVKLGFMSFFVKAAVQALKAIPALNAQIEGDELVQNHYFDIGVAVGTDRGLMVPVVRDCDQLSFAGVEKGIGELSKKARDGKIKIEDLQGGVFTISNGGIYGSMLSTPILNPPQSGILGLHNITQRAVVVDGQIVARPMMYLALSYDHRVVDGKEAVTFLVHLKQAIEDPARLLFAL